MNGEGEEGESGSTATATFVRDDVLVVSHVGDSCVVCSLPAPCNTGENCNFLFIYFFVCFNS